jgi:hypothetical protein
MKKIILLILLTLMSAASYKGSSRAGWGQSSGLALCCANS